MDTAQPDQPAVKINLLTRRSRLVLILTLVIAAFTQLITLNINLTALLADSFAVGLLFPLIFNLISLTLIWLLAYRYLSFIVALIAGVMYAVSPWAAASNIFGAFNALLALLTIIAFALAFLGFIENRRWAKILCVPGFVIVVISTYLLLLNTPSARASNPDLALSTNALSYSIQVGTGLGSEDYFLYRGSDLLLSVPRPTEIWLLVLGIAMLLGFPALWFRSRTLLALITLWVIVPILIFTPNWIMIYPDYFIPLLPALCLLAGTGVAWLIKLMPGKPYSRMIILSAYGVVFLSQALWWRGVLRYLELTAR